MQFIQVTTAVDSREAAERIANEVVGGRLAACAQIIGPIHSVYRWKGGLESALEWLCLIKTAEDRYPELEETIRELHPYELPEILASPVLNGLDEYLNWIEMETRDRG